MATNSYGFHGQAQKLNKISLYLLLVALTVAECSLTTVLQSTASAPVGSPGALGRGYGKDLEPIRVSMPRIEKSSEDLGLTLKSSNPLKSGPSSSLAALEEIEHTPAENLMHKLGGMVKNVIAPTKSYVELVQRYHKWFYNYRKLRSVSERKLRDPNDVLKDEYSKVDEMLVKKEHEKHAATSAKLIPNDVQGSESGEMASKLAIPLDTKKLENMDFVFKALRIVIDRLEKNLEELEKRENIPIDEDSVSASEAEPKNDERIRAAMERVKKTVMNSAKNLVTGEMAIIARTAVFNGLAAYMDAKPDTGDALDHLRPIISMLGSASTPVAVSYLMGLEFRAALAVVNQANPLSLFGINLKKPQEAMA